MTEKVFLVIVNFNGERFIGECLGAVKKLKTGDWEKEIIIVDNGSTDRSVKLAKQLRVIENKKNLGFATGANIGIKEALKNGADYVFLLNPDTKISPNALIQLIKPEADIAGPVAGRIEPKRWSANLKGITQKNFAYISGTAMLIKRAVFEKIGFFDERYFLYYEDLDFCLRAKEAGFKLVWLPQARIFHRESSSVNQTPGLKDYCLAKSYQFFFAKWAPLDIKIRELIRLNIKNWLIIFWLLIAFGLYGLLWLFRFLEPWQKSLPVMSAKESLKFLARKIGIWP